MKRLLIIISSMTYGGAEIQTIELANGLIGLNYDIDVVVLDHRKDVIGQAHPKIRFHVMCKKSYLDRNVLKKLTKMIGEIEPNMIFCVDLYPNLYAQLSLVGKKGQIPITTVLHSTLPCNIKEKFQRLYLTKFLKKVDQLIFVSEKQMHYWINNYGLKRINAKFIHNGVNIEKFVGFLSQKAIIEEIRNRYNFNEDDVVIGNCSKFRIEKRHQDLLKAVFRLKDEGYPVKLLLIGDGEMRSQIEKSIQALGLEDVVTITGYVSDVRPYLAMVDIFVLSSVSVETLSIAAIEGQAMKKVAILSDIGGASEIVVDGVNGYLYPPGDVEKLTEKMRMILEKRSWENMGEAAYSHAFKNFQKSKMVKDYDLAFSRLIAGN